MLHTTDADEAASAALLLTTVRRLHRQLDDFTTHLYTSHDFGDDSGLVPAVLVEERATGPELRLHHRFGFFAEGDADVSELRFSAGVTVTPGGCIVEAVVEVDLERPRGEFRAGCWILYSERIAHLSLREALGRLEEQVAVLCGMDDVPKRLGFPAR
ncbi:hypothetical protein [Streptomyces sp. enrichment culture]|uniref:hypothetical protein n=1 Tax=Streptomyces sp. enrichment culture TaxID=1795815 RepID=UPI003F5577E5